jgi:DNA-binding NtrC family response regulator
MKVSRVQMAIRALAEGLEVRQLGRLPILHNDRESAAATLRPGDTLQVGGQLLFLCVRRPAWLPAPAAACEDPPFGGPDSHGVVGESPAAWSLRERIAFAGGRREHLLILGASGTGKELVARAVHALSPQGDRPFVARNAATIPESLVDAELFGNARNYPNTGMAERPGLIGEANGTTLFLDEIAELPDRLQAHLLRVLDGGEYQRLGDSRSRRSEFRLIGATNRPTSAIKHDLAARLPLRIEVPDLNERVEDVPLIARHLLEELAARRSLPVPATGCDASRPRSLSLDLVGRLVRHRYTTNVRELERFLLESLAAAGTGDVLDLAPDREPTGAPAAAPAAAEAPLPAAPGHAVSPEELQRVLDRHRGNIEDAVRDLGFSSRHVLVRLVSKHRLRAGRSWRPPDDVS